MSAPIDIRTAIKNSLWEAADRLDWETLGPAEKSRYYEQWTDSDIGRTLAAHMDPRRVRVYIKDTLLKGYGREKLNANQEIVLRVIDRPRSDAIQSYIKPHGFRFSDGAFTAWGRADDWKSLLGALFERSYPSEGGDLSAFLFRAAPRYIRPVARELVETAARRLGISRCFWFD